jgi:hypothetical protein
MDLINPNDRRRDSPTRLKYPERDGIPEQNDFMSGQQILARNLAMVRTQSQADALLSLGGQECKVLADFANDQYAYIHLPFWSPPSVDSLPLPLPSELLSQQITLTVELDNNNNIFTPPVTGWLGTASVLPNGFQSAFFQVSQRNMVDKSQAIPGEKLNEEGYILPLASFEQQVLKAPLGAQAGEQEVAFSGFRSGQCTKLRVWLVERNALTGQDDNINSLMWYAPHSISVIYGGLTYGQYSDFTSQMWNLIEGTKPAAVNQSVLSAVNGAWASTPKVSQYTELPFGQPISSDMEASITTQSIRITNGTVNLRVTTPDPTKAYSIFCSPVYNACIAFQRGTADVIVN